MRNAFAVCLALGCGSAFAADIPLQGTYGTLFGCSAEREGGLFDADSGQPKLRLARSELRGLEFACKVVMVTNGPGAGSWRVELSCSGEGSTWSDAAAVVENRTTGTVTITAKSFAPAAVLDDCQLPYTTRVQREADRLTAKR